MKPKVVKMKVIYEFGPDDRSERRIFDRAEDFYLALSDIYQTIRTQLKYDQGDPEEVIETIRDLVVESGVLEVE